MPDQNFGTLVIHRKWSIMNRARSFKIHVNDAEIGTIKNNKTETIDLPAGNHSLNITIDWLSSNQFEFSLAPNQKVFLVVKNNLVLAPVFYLLFLLVLLLPLVLHIPLFKSPAWNSIKYGTMFIFFSYLLFYLTLGRKKYLTILPDTSTPFS